jgi:hypothetical protein
MCTVSICDVNLRVGEPRVKPEASVVDSSQHELTRRDSIRAPEMRPLVTHIPF